ncbi:MAG TPA: cobalt-precorrin-5B (C(1))-methyltransferase [Geobacteraceae bacterium]
MATKKLTYGYTTGACATAAAKGAAQMLRDQRRVDEVELVLPAGEAARFPLHGQEFTSAGARCYVVKDAGDDPDVTNGAHVHAAVLLEPGYTGASREIVIEGGEGVGRVTKPGLAVAVGEWAINPVPRLMISGAVHEVFAACHPSGPLRVTISIPNGEELAKKTLNARLGIVGGLSILGTTGIVRPVSVEAWTSTIDTAIDVALACGAPGVVLSTGRTSELVAQRLFMTPAAAGFPEEAFVMMGDHVGYALRACARRGVARVVLAAQFAKLLKIACGHEQTHVASSSLDLGTLAGWVTEELGDTGLAGRVAAANTAREVLSDCERRDEIIALVASRARAFAERLAPGGAFEVFLAGYDGEVLYYYH